MKKLPYEKLDSLFEIVASSSELYIPVDKENGQATYEKWEEGKKLSGALNTVRSAKDFFFPQTENLVDFKVEGKTIEVKDIRRETEDFVVFGVRACDAKSFDILDRVFLCDPVDTYYKNRREHGTIVTMACNSPRESCFCTAFGIDPAAPGGDVEAYSDGKFIYFNALTEKGNAFIEGISGLLEDTDDKAVNEQKKRIGEIMKKLPLASLSTDKFKGDVLLKLFSDEKWKELSEACIGCGTCTFVCPTCQCYDVRDIKTADGVRRYRCWDSCMYSDFTKMAHGNPRLTQLERFRQRFMHKLVYYPENNEGIFGCVGCGRCINKCPISMNIVKVMKALGGND